MAWTKLLSQLRDALASMIPFKIDTLPYLKDAGINMLVINMSDNPLTLWNNILTYADNNDMVDALVNVLLIQYPGNPHLLSFKDKLDYSLGKEVKELEWKGKIAKDTLEKITGESSTLLPISFLEMGIKKAKSVARVIIKKQNGTEAGTGFLLPNNLFLTNHHVFPDIETARIAKIQFDYEESLSGLALQPTDFMTDPDKGFATSDKNDWSVVRIKGDANTAFGAIDLSEVSIAKNDFVNIVQHPGGRYKQIGMYHNLVTYSDAEIIQYLTDTEPGSSGSPVFNSKWEVVALHHSGGMLREPGTNQTLLRNEGINIKVVIDGIKSNNL